MAVNTTKSRRISQLEVKIQRFTPLFWSRDHRFWRTDPK